MQESSEAPEERSEPAAVAPALAPVPVASMDPVEESRPAFRGAAILELGIVVLMAASAASFLGSSVREHSRQDGERKQLLQEARSAATEQSLAIHDYTSSGSGRARDQAITAAADLAARLDALELSWPEETARIDDVREQGILSGQAAEALWNGSGRKEQRKLSNFESIARVVAEGLSALDLELTHESTRKMKALAERCYAVLAGLAVVHVIVGLMALRREHRDWGRWRTASRDLGRGLAAARSDEARVRLDPIFGRPVQRAFDALQNAYHGMIVASGEERRHARFAQELIEALEIDDTPEHVYETVSRAARLRLPGSRFRLLVSDNSGTSLEPRVAEGAPLCDAPLPHRCPAIRKGRLVSFTDASGLARCPFLKDEDSRVLCAPVAAAGKAFAAAQLAVNDGDESDVLATDLTTLVGTLGTRLGVLRTLVERELQAATDPLTGLANRRAMGHELAQLDRSGVAYAVLACDLDHFKRLNDVHGHETGDKCLVAFAQILKEQSREGDVPCRPGGEEFLVIAKGVDADGALVLADRIREGLAFACQQGGPAYTVSIGIAANPEHSGNADDLLKISDKALYEAKDQGRDRAVIAASAGGRRAAVKPKAEQTAKSEEA